MRAMFIQQQTFLYNTHMDDTSNYMCLGPWQTIFTGDKVKNIVAHFKFICLTVSNVWL